MRKRVLLDEHLSESIGEAFGPRAIVHAVKNVGLSGMPDDDVIDYGIENKCLIVTNDWGLVERYKAHPARRSKRGPRFFYGLIYLRAETDEARKRHLAAILKEIAWGETRQHDDLIIVDRDGRAEHYRLCHPECAAEFDRAEGRVTG